MGSKPPQPTDIIPREEAGTLPGLFAKRVDRSPDAVAYCEYRGSPDAVAYCEYRDGRWEEQTWREMVQRVSCLRGAIACNGLKPGDRAAILLPNGTDWVAFDVAAMANGLITVPLYAHDSPENIAFVLAE